ncbi:hypothetical protein ACFV3R_24080 [Streptomyces sp. NPDC059740]|uniref:effector-associated constant component EACC1 n=1 Tax=Streptomyces sp. NPDC059740 TaxID=3346926 RepID=UPI003659CB29
MVILTFSAEEPADSQASLHTWLCRDRRVRLHARISLRPVSAPAGSMGTAFDAIQLAVDSSFQLASLILSVAAWRQACRPRSAPVVEAEDHTVSLTADGDVVVTRDGRSTVIPAGQVDADSVRHALTDRRRTDEPEEPAAQPVGTDCLGEARAHPVRTGDPEEPPGQPARLPGPRPDEDPADGAPGPAAADSGEPDAGPCPVGPGRDPSGPSR